MYKTQINTKSEETICQQSPSFNQTNTSTQPIFTSQHLIPNTPFFLQRKEFNSDTHCEFLELANNYEQSHDNKVNVWYMFSHIIYKRIKELKVKDFKFFISHLRFIMTVLVLIKIIKYAD